jgi:hypothetical protein
MKQAQELEHPNSWSSPSPEVLKPIHPQELLNLLSSQSHASPHIQEQLKL